MQDLIYLVNSNLSEPISVSAPTINMTFYAQIYWINCKFDMRLQATIGKIKWKKTISVHHHSAAHTTARSPVPNNRRGERRGVVMRAKKKL